MFSLHRTSAILAAFAFIGATSGCGQIGPLYLPGKPPPAPSSSDASDAQPEAQLDSASPQPNSR